MRVYRDIVACAVQPMTQEVKAGHGGWRVDPDWIREQVHPRNQLLPHTVGTIEEVPLGMGLRAAQHTLHMHTFIRAHRGNQADTSNTHAHSLMTNTYKVIAINIFGCIGSFMKEWQTLTLKRWAESRQHMVLCWMCETRMYL